MCVCVCVCVCMCVCVCVCVCVCARACVPFSCPPAPPSHPLPQSAPPPPAPTSKPICSSRSNDETRCCLVQSLTCSLFANQYVLSGYQHYKTYPRVCNNRTETSAHQSGRKLLKGSEVGVGGVRARQILGRTFSVRPS